MAKKEFNFNENFTKKRLIEFAEVVEALSEKAGFKISARGWCYQMEQEGYINKSQFGKVEEAINRCRREGFLPVDFVAEEDSRAFEGVEKESDRSIEDTLDWMLRDVIDGQKYYTPDWWEGEEYYIQMVVEKIDLKTLFAPVCSEYHIPVANARGWSSIHQRAEYARRFKEAEDAGLKCVLLYCGDHDPDGLRISDTLRKNLEQVQHIRWSDGKLGYDPEGLTIKRFGLNYDFIKKMKYTWIDNLITNGKDKSGIPLDLSKKTHRNHELPYVQKYLKKIGARKCEANAIVTTPKEARDLVRKEIESWVGPGALTRFAVKREKVKAEYGLLLDESNLTTPIQEFLNRDEIL